MSLIKYSSGIVVASKAGKGEININHPQLCSKQTIEKQAAKIEKLSNDNVYSVVVGIQGDVFNENWDYWDWDKELMQKNSSGMDVWKSWIGKPNCIDHKCASVMDHYGKVIDCYPNYPPKHVMMVIATSRKKDPGLADGIEAGYIDKVSMSCAVGHSLCSYCGKKASTPQEYCEHIKYARGKLLPVKKELKYYKGANVEDGGFVRVGEICFDSTGRELSWVSNPAFGECTVISRLKLAEKLNVIADIYKNRNESKDAEISNVIRKAASKDMLSIDEKKAIRILLDKTGKGIYKTWVR